MSRTKVRDLKESRDHKLKNSSSRVIFFLLSLAKLNASTHSADEANWHFAPESCLIWRLERHKHEKKIDRKEKSLENRLYEIYYICNTCFSTVKMP